MIRICAWCRRVEDCKTGEWFTTSSDPPGRDVTHVICPDCADEEDARFDAEMGAKGGGA